MDIPGSVLAEPDWLAEQVQRLAHAWGIRRSRSMLGSEVARVSATVWWYMACSTMLAAPVEAVVRGSALPDPALDRVTCRVDPDGRLVEMRHPATLVGPPGPALRAVLGSVIGALSEASGATGPSLWAIASDTIANLTLGAGAREGLRSKVALVSVGLADAIGADMPAPRFVAVDSSLFVRRNSCCLIYRTPGSATMCTSCPRRPPEQRQRLLAALARGDR